MDEDGKVAQMSNGECEWMSVGKWSRLTMMIVNVSVSDVIWNV